AAEKMKDEVFKLFHEYDTNHNGTLAVNPPIITGLALYDDAYNPITISDPMANIPWGTKTGEHIDQMNQNDCCSGSNYVNASRMGKVTTRLKLPDVTDQTTASPTSRFPYTLQIGDAAETSIDSDPGPGKKASDALYRYFENRCRQMGAEDNTQIKSVWNSMEDDVGEMYYVCVEIYGKGVYSTEKPDSIRDLVIPEPSTEPPGLGGKTIKYKRKYNINGTMVNAGNDFNIHDRMFQIQCQP